MPVLLVVLVCVTSWRATRLLVLDAFPPVKAFRDMVERRAGENSSWAYLVNCMWCVGVWVAGGVTLATALLTHGDLPYPWLVWGTAAGAAGFLGMVEDALL